MSRSLTREAVAILLCGLGGVVMCRGERPARAEFRAVPLEKSKPAVTFYERDAAARSAAARW